MKQTKEKLLQAALEMISERGYLGATTRQIASRAGVTEVTLFRHFPSKEKLFEEVLKKYSFLPALREMLPGAEARAPREVLRELALQYLKVLQLRKKVVRIMLSEIALYPDKLKRVYNSFLNEMIKTLSGYFQSLQGSGRLRAVNPERASRAFLGMLFSFFLTEEVIRGRRLKRETLEEVVSEFVDIFLKGVER